MLRIFATSLIAHTLYTRVFSLIFVMWDFFYLKCSQVTWRYKKRLIRDLNKDHQSLLTTGVRGTFLFVGELFLKQFNLNHRSEKL